MRATPRAPARDAARYSYSVAPTDDGSGAPHLEYLDALPFPRADLDAHRAEVCDYCFYGGPTKLVPIIP